MFNSKAHTLSVQWSLLPDCLQQTCCGLFEIQLPGNASTWLATQGNDSLIGHFVQGMFATLLATPCSAPFLGTAIAFALGANIATLVMIFTALAIGMAAPWLLIAAIPRLATLLPKPGQWMNKVKLAFGLMMLASSFWATELNDQSSRDIDHQHSWY